MGWRPVDFEFCRPAYFFDALTGHYAAKNERFEFAYNIARISVCTLRNVQLTPETQVLPSAMWPDWNSKEENNGNETIDPQKLNENIRSAIDFLNKR